MDADRINLSPTSANNATCGYPAVCVKLGLLEFENSEAGRIRLGAVASGHGMPLIFRVSGQRFQSLGAFHQAPLSLAFLVPMKAAPSCCFDTRSFNFSTSAEKVAVFKSLLIGGPPKPNIKSRLPGKPIPSFDQSGGPVLRTTHVAQ